MNARMSIDDSDFYADCRICGGRGCLPKTEGNRLSVGGGGGWDTPCPECRGLGIKLTHDGEVLARLIRRLYSPIV